MKIEKYRFLSNGRYEVIIDNEKYIIYEDIILKNNLLSKKEITKSFLDDLLINNSFYEAYYKAVSYINLKLRTKREIETYLKKSNFNTKVIKDVLIKLEEDNYINDDIYSKAYIHDQMILKMVGPNKIKVDLIKMGLKEDVIDNNLDVYSEEKEFEKLEKIIPKLINNNKNKSSSYLKNKLLNDLLNKGFTKEYIITVLEKQEFDDSDIYKKEYDKLYKKLSKKYSGNELEFKIKQKLYSKGFRQN